VEELLLELRSGGTIVGSEEYGAIVGIEEG
jgi:hypothetical protein